jgi:hypothetical protein
MGIFVFPVRARDVLPAMIINLADETMKQKMTI